ncbi:MAG: flagellar biosynthesis protein FlgF, partial [Halochromatium sp.]|nr:flagellar biosynthesis protein FlgF [Halochromatium sp.]
RAQLFAARAVPVQGEAATQTRVSTAATTPGSDFTAGPISTTGRPLDVAIDGEGWIAVQAEDGTEAYTRRGELQINSNGVLEIVGRPVIGEGGPVIVPLESQLSIGDDGTLSAIGPGQGPDAIADIGRIKLVNPGPLTLERGDDGLFRAPPDAGGAIAPLPRDEAVTLASGSLEGSNVSVVETMVAMINAARYFEMQMTVISTADENDQRANSLLSLQG